MFLRAVTIAWQVREWMFDRTEKPETHFILPRYAGL